MLTKPKLLRRLGLGLLALGLPSGCIDGDRMPSADQYRDTSDDSQSDTAPAELTLPEGIDRIVLVVMDTTRWDVAVDTHVMPALTGLTSEGVYLSNNWGDGNWTRPGTASIATGMTGLAIGEDLYANDDVDQIPKSVPNIGEHLLAAGWATRMDTCNPVVDEVEATRNYQSLQVCEDPQTNSEPASTQFERTGDWLETAGTPAFAWIQTMESHDPLNGPAPSCKDAVVKAIAGCPNWTGMLDQFAWDFGDPNEDAACTAAVWEAYTCDTTNLDDDFTTALADWNARGLLDRTLLVFTADHGADLAEFHGDGQPRSLSHHAHMYAQVSRVHASLWWPSVSPYTVMAPSAQMDVAATVLAVAGVAPSNTLGGISVFDIEALEPRILTQFACEQETNIHGAVYVLGQVTYHSVARVHRNSGDVTWVSYDADSDPAETTPLIDFSVPQDVQDVIRTNIALSEDWNCM